MDNTDKTKLTTTDRIEVLYTRSLDTNANIMKSSEIEKDESHKTSIFNNLLLSKENGNGTYKLTIPIAPPPPPPLQVQSPHSVNMTTAPLIHVPKKTKRMRPLNWKKMTVPLHTDNIWTKIYKDLKDVDKVNYKTLEELFVISSEKSAQNNSKDKKTLLDCQKSMPVKLLLQKYESTENVIDMIQCGITNDSDLVQYQEIHKILSDEKMVKMMRDQSADDIRRLGEEDSFMVRLVKLPDCVLWIKMISTKGKFDALNSLSPHLEVMRSACVMLMTDASFQTFLGYVLRVGLFMNKTDVLDQAVGFKTSSLRQLMNTKSTKDEKLTLLEFLVNEIKSSDGRGLDFVDKFWNILKHVKSSSMEQIFCDFYQLQIELRTMTEIVKASADSSKQIKEKCLAFQKQKNLLERGNGRVGGVVRKSAAKQFENVKDEVHETQLAIQTMTNYFCEDSKTVNVDDLLACCKELCVQIKGIEQKAVCSPNKFERGNLRASMPVGKRQPFPVPTSDFNKDTRLLDTLERRKRLSECDPTVD